ncbi:MAG: type II toxin-antitoxin system HicB family antitoxin [Patescibacteria group bacterium]|nr:type II toxin-antitoxin system HicB family antitoxin [Patescibacteria group bacterium]
MKKRARKKEIIINGLNALVWKEDDLYVAKAVEVEIASQGKTRADAKKNLQEALELYFENEKIPSNKISPLSTLKLEKLFLNIRYA